MPSEKAFWGDCTWSESPAERFESSYRLIYVSRFGYLGSSLPPKATVRMQAAAYREFLDHLTMWPRARFDLRARCPAGPVSRPLRVVARPQDYQDARCCQHAPEWPSALPGATARVLGHALGIAGRLVSTGMHSSCCLASFLAR
jgi:hypothetical protein